MILHAACISQAACDTRLTNNVLGFELNKFTNIASPAQQIE